MAARHGGLDAVIGGYVGAGKPFKSFEEFEACLRMPGRNLRPEQVQAINAIREAIGIPAVNARVVKVLDLQRADEMVLGGDPNLSGFFTERTAVEDLLGPGGTTQKFNDRLRLDRPGTPFVEGAPHVILETKMTSTIRGNSKYPRTADFSNGNSAEYVTTLSHPNDGHGLVLCKDGHNVAETTTAATAMSAADELGVPDTIMRFRFADGTPYPRLLNGVTASDWRLVPHSSIPDVFVWIPYP